MKPKNLQSAWHGSWGSMLDGEALKALSRGLAGCDVTDAREAIRFHSTPLAVHDHAWGKHPANSGYTIGPGCYEDFPIHVGLLRVAPDDYSPPLRDKAEPLLGYRGEMDARIYCAKVGLDNSAIMRERVGQGFDKLPPTRNFRQVSTAEGRVISWYMSPSPNYWVVTESEVLVGCEGEVHRTISPVNFYQRPESFASFSADATVPYVEEERRDSLTLKLWPEAIRLEPDQAGGRTKWRITQADLLGVTHEFDFWISTQGTSRNDQVIETGLSGANFRSLQMVEANAWEYSSPSTKNSLRECGRFLEALRSRLDRSGGVKSMVENAVAGVVREQG